MGFQLGGQTFDEAQINGETASEVQLNGVTIWEDAVVVEDFEHNDLNGNYVVSTDDPDNIVIVSDEAYTGTYSLFTPHATNSGGDAYAVLSNFDETMEAGRTYRVPFMLQDNTNDIQMRFFWNTDNARPYDNGGYEIRLRPGNEDFRVSAWGDDGTVHQHGNDNLSANDFRRFEWDYIEISHENPEDAGSNTIAVRLIVNDTVVASGSVDRRSDIANREQWMWYHPWGWEAHWYGGIYEVSA